MGRVEQNKPNPFSITDDNPVDRAIIGVDETGALSRLCPGDATRRALQFIPRASYESIKDCLICYRNSVSLSRIRAHVLSHRRSYA